MVPLPPELEAPPGFGAAGWRGPGGGGRFASTVGGKRKFGRHRPTDGALALEPRCCAGAGAGRGVLEAELLGGAGEPRDDARFAARAAA